MGLDTEATATEVPQTLRFLPSQLKLAPRKTVELDDGPRPIDTSKSKAIALRLFLFRFDSKNRSVTQKHDP